MQRGEWVYSHSPLKYQNEVMEQPNLKEKEQLANIFKKEEIKIAGTNKTYKIGYMKGYTLEKLTDISLWIRKYDGSDDKKFKKKKIKLVAKQASYAILNGMKIFFFHWIFWRYLYYIKGYTYNQLEPILEAIKKKTPLRAYIKATTLAYLMDIMIMNVSEEEQKEVLQELISDKGDNSEKSTVG